MAGLDVLTDDISVPFHENGATILEVNASPGLRMHTDPDDGAPRDTPARRWGVATGHPRVLLCGAGAVRGGGVSGIGGHNAAMATLEILRA